MASKVKVELDRAHLTARMKAGKEHCGQFMAQQIIDDCNLYSVPDDGENTLKDSARPEKIGEDWCATWNTVYAPYQYYGCRPDGTHVVKNHTQGYTADPSTVWCEHARDRYGKDWAEVAQREFARGSEIG